MPGGHGANAAALELGPLENSCREADTALAGMWSSLHLVRSVLMPCTHLVSGAHDARGI